MKLLKCIPKSKIGQICLAISGFYLWGIYYCVAELGLGETKPLVGAVVGFLVFGGLAWRELKRGQT